MSKQIPRQIMFPPSMSPDKFYDYVSNLPLKLKFD